VWLAWSMIAFIVAILSYVWRTGATNDPANSVWPRLTPQQSLGPRLAITSIVALGLVYFALIVLTFARYASPGPRYDVIGMSRKRPSEGAEVNAERGRASQRGHDRKNGKDLMTDIRPSGIGLGLRAFVSNSLDADLEKDAGVELGAQGRYKTKL
jgi:hypothetical protein